MKNIAGVKDLKLIPIYIPPFNKQKRILDKIEELFSDLDMATPTFKASSKAKPKPPKDKPHVSTARLLAQARETKKRAANSS